MRKKYLLNSPETPGAGIARRVFSSPPLEIPLSRSEDRFECIQLEEPELVFGGNHRCVDPRTGLAAFGPYSDASGGSRNELRIGIVGTGEAIETAAAWLQKISKPVEQDPNVDCILHPSFPGLNSGEPFSVDVVMQPSWRRSIDARELRLAEDCGNSAAKLGILRELFGAEVRALSNLEIPPNVVICAAPARVERSLLQAACGQSLPVEIIREDKWPETDAVREDEATEAWNFSVRLLHKAGLTLWRVADAAGDACFAGVSFYREPESSSPQAWRSFAHVVTDLGQGCFLRGEVIRGETDAEMQETPHLDEGQAARLMGRVLEFYEKIAGRLPRKVVVHKSLPFSEAERLGIQDSLRGIERQALVSVRESRMFFLRSGRQPVFRGAAIPFGEKLGLVYLSGFIPFLHNSFGKQVPLPFEIAENWGSLTFQQAAADLLRLTKLSWSTSAFCSEVPATLDFPKQAREVLGILGEKDVALDDRYCL